VLLGHVVLQAGGPRSSRHPGHPVLLGLVVFRARRPRSSRHPVLLDLVDLQAGRPQWAVRGGFGIFTTC